MATQNTSLTKKELFYYNIIRVNSGVLYLTSAPGLAKTAIIESIAQKKNLELIDLRTSRMDESDFGAPKLIETEREGKKIVLQVTSIPEWAILANEKPTIIVFDELNRARQAVQDACLGILLERRIGFNFKLNNNVYLVATGNLGIDDDTNVNCFDAALNNRLIHIRHSMSLAQWLDAWANENVIDVVRNFLKAYPEYYHNRFEKNAEAYPTPRSWTFCSDFLKENSNCSNSDLLECLTGTVGVEAANKFFNFYNQKAELKMGEILNAKNQEELLSRLETISIGLQNELLETLLRDYNISSLVENQYHNLILFLDGIEKDRSIGFFLTLFESDSFTPESLNPEFRKFLKHFEWVKEYIQVEP